MGLTNALDDTQLYIMKVGEETKVEARSPFSAFPSLHVVKVVKDGLHVDTSFFPTAASLPSTKHPNTIRLLNLNWNGYSVKAEYDDSSKLLKVLSGNVDSVTIRIK